MGKIVLQVLAILHDDGYVHTGVEAPYPISLYNIDKILDNKPDNILFNCKEGKTVDREDSEDRFGEVQVADFGSCVLASSTHAKNGELIGAPIFRSPEASLRLPWGTATDIWSFGAMVSLPLLVYIAPRGL